MNKRRYPSPLNTGAKAKPQPGFEGQVWLTTNQAADRLGTTPCGIRNLVYRGCLQAHKPDGNPRGHSRFKKADLDRLFVLAPKGGKHGI